MSPAVESVRAIGRLGSGGSWVGFTATPDGHRLVFGGPNGSVRVDATAEPVRRRDGLVAAAIAFFLSSLPEPPAELEATQADIAHLVRSLPTGPLEDPGVLAQAREALDAIDDGLAGDAVALRLGRLLPPGTDALEILRGRAAETA